MNAPAHNSLPAAQVEARSHAWLTTKRLRAHAAILALCLWSLYVWNLSTPGLLDRNRNIKGTDFLHFYILGSLAAAHRGGDLYDMNAAAALTAERVPEAAGKRYLPLYPPQVSLLFLPLARLPYAEALAIWWCCSALIYAACCYAVWRACPRLGSHRTTVLLCAAAFPGFFHLLAWGQTSALALACFTLTFFLLRADRRFLTGAVLGCLIFKPQLGLAAAVVFLSLGAWKIIAGAVASSLAQLSIGVLYFGWGPLRQWIRMLEAVRTQWQWLEPRPYQTHSLRTFWTLLIPWENAAFVLYVCSAALVLGMTIALWRSRSAVPLSLRYCCLLLATVLVSPHLTVYDLVILAPAFLLGADWLAGSDTSTPGLSSLLYLAYVLPLVSPVTRWTHVQPSVLAMAAALYVIWRALRQTVKHPTGEGSSVDAPSPVSS